ncbi:hypothetical protein [Streptomyces sp. NPDC000931]|uniref:hypothetical protein n=1 Tax=Streptomyces sp. NPDC000931 TaxID=3154372 RepID=UPI00331D66AA
MDENENPPVHPEEMLNAKITLAVIGMAFVAGLVAIRFSSELAARLAELLTFTVFVLTGIAMRTSARIKRERKARAHEIAEQRSRQEIIEMLRASGLGISNTVNGPVHGVVVQGRDFGGVHLHDPDKDEVPRSWSS